ncbi:hypothetical protein GCM10022223_57890 [Kineosporia mesophila]|uniref:Uncharacterized protein n=2 Tax=Kineosporiaceae TaxID=83778 RepID=A0ABP7AHG2_9ACTN
MQLGPAAVLADPDVGERPAELGMPHERGQVIEDNGHTDVVDRRIGDGLDRPVGAAAPPEEPDVAGSGQLGGLGQEKRLRSGHDPYPRPMAKKQRRIPWWKLIGLAGAAGVAAGGALVVRNERQRQSYTPEQVRERLQQRLTEADGNS